MYEYDNNNIAEFGNQRIKLQQRKWNQLSSPFVD